MRPLILLAIAVISASLWHCFLPRFWLASIMATVTTVVMFGVFLGLLDLGPRTLYIEYFVLAEILGTDFLGAVAVFDAVTSSLGAFVVSLLIGSFFRAHRNHPRTGKQT